MRNFILALFFTVGLLSTSVWAADSYKIDSVHSNIGFSIKHMMVSNTIGQFDQYDGQITYDPQDLANSKINVTIQTAGINTHNDKRDGHLKSPDFFDTAKFPIMTFVSKKITATEIVGDLSIKGITKEVTIPTTIAGPITGMGMTKIGINGTFVLNRQDYGISFNKTMDQGGLAVGNDVTINISVEADKQEASVANSDKK